MLQMLWTWAQHHWIGSVQLLFACYFRWDSYQFRNWLRISVYHFVVFKFKLFGLLSIRFQCRTDPYFLSPNITFEIYTTVVSLWNGQKSMKQLKKKTKHNSYEWDECEWWIWQSDSTNHVNLHFDGKVFICAINAVGGPWSRTNNNHTNKRSAKRTGK